MPNATHGASRSSKPLSKKFVFAQVRGFNDAGELEAVASTADIDRQGESIEPGAWADSLPAYRDNPVVLATHMHRLADGRSSVIGSCSGIDVVKGELVFRMRFAATDLGREYETLYHDKHMRAFSVGFIPGSGEWRNLTVGGKPGVRTFVHTKVELIEISAVPVPANPAALARMVELAEASERDDPSGDVIDELVESIKALTDRVDAELGAVKSKLMDLADLVALSPGLPDGDGDSPDAGEKPDDAPPAGDGSADGSAGDGHDDAARDAASRSAAKAAADLLAACGG